MNAKFFKLSALHENAVVLRDPVPFVLQFGTNTCPCTLAESGAKAKFKHTFG